MKGVLYGTHKSLKDICNYLEEGIFEIFLIYFIYHIKIGSMYSYVVQKKSIILCRKYTFSGGHVNLFSSNSRNLIEHLANLQWHLTIHPLQMWALGPR